MDQRPSAKVPAAVKLAGWTILAVSLVSPNPVGIVAGILVLKYADRIAGKIAEASKLPVKNRVAGAQADGGLPGRGVEETSGGDGEFLIPCPFCRKLNEPKSGKCRYCGYAM